MQIDDEIIRIMDDEELKKFVPIYGDRVAIKNFVQRCNSSVPIASSSKERIIDKIRKRLKLPTTSENPLKRICNSEKTHRMVELGWMVQDEGCARQVRAKTGGGTRKALLSKSSKKNDIIEECKRLFFPGGYSTRGPATDFLFDLLDFKGNIFPEHQTIQDLLKNEKIKYLRFYLYTLPKLKTGM